MDITTLLPLLLGVLLRLGLPMVLTGLAIGLFRHWDAAWVAQAAQQPAQMPVAIRGPRCWELRGCSPEQRRECPAFNQPDRPCWQHFRRSNGDLRTDCLSCPVFRHAPAPGHAGRSG